VVSRPVPTTGSSGSPSDRRGEEVGGRACAEVAQPVPQAT
jgi:hypothetical protein